MLVRYPSADQALSSASLFPLPSSHTHSTAILLFLDPNAIVYDPYACQLRQFMYSSGEYIRPANAHALRDLIRPLLHTSVQELHGLLREDCRFALDEQLPLLKAAWSKIHYCLRSILDDLESCSVIAETTGDHGEFVSGCVLWSIYGANLL